MKRIYSFVMIICLTFNLTGLAKENAPSDCKDVLHWIYKELTLNNLELSYERTRSKFLVSLLQVEKNLNQIQGTNPATQKIFNTLKKIDPKFKKLLKTRGSAWRRFFSRKKSLSTNSLQAVITSWKKLQDSDPKLFKGLNKDYLLDEWDIKTMQLIDDVSTYKFSNSNIKRRVSKLSDLLNSSRVSVLKNQSFSKKKLIKSFDSTKHELIKSLKENYSDILKDFEGVCSSEELNQLIIAENYVCPLPKKESGFIALTAQLEELTDVLQIRKPSNILPTIEVPDVPEPTNTNGEIPVEVLEYERSDDPRSLHCKRDPEMISTIVIHHTETEKSISPHEINRWHLERESGGEPWYMIGYNYLVSESFNGATPDNLKVFQGREPEIQGAHAGGYTARLTKKEKKFYKNYTVSCGNEQVGYTEEPALNFLDENGGIKGNLISYGIAVIGNYSPLTFEWVAGIPMPININQTDRQYYPSEQTIEKLAQLSCSLQKKNPNIKHIKPHQYFKGTKCPGTLIYYLNRISERARELGCEFDVTLSKGK